MSLSFSRDSVYFPRYAWGGMRVAMGTLTFDSSYAGSGGEAVTASLFGLDGLSNIMFLGQPDGYQVEFNPSTSKVIAYNKGAATIGELLEGGLNAGVMTDDDDAASNGTALYVVPGSDGVLAHFESTTAGNASAGFLAGAGGPQAWVYDNDSPGGVQVYFDEDATNADERFLCVSPTGKDLFVPLSDGSLLRVKHDASAASNGVAVYFDDDGASANLRLLFVSPTDADGSYSTDDTVTMQAPAAISQAAGSEVEAATDLSSVAISVIVFGY